MRLRVLVGVLTAVLSAVNAGFLRPPSSLPRINTNFGANSTNDTSADCIPGVLPNSGINFFQQRLNHSDPDSNATFSQKYFWSNATWGGPGYPVILMTPGEQAMDVGFCDFLTNISVQWQMASAVQAAIVLIEHRYYGDSSPFQTLTTETLQHLTLHNAIHDLTYFASTVRLPFDKNGSSNSPVAPWILSGGSYSGALAAWTARLAPDVFWAYHASSAPVQTIYNYWQYFEPIHQGMPSNCSRDLTAIVEYVDNATLSLPPEALHAFKDQWGLASIENAIDFASALSYAVDNWQDNTLTSGYTKFYQMCDAIEGFGLTDNTTARNSFSRRQLSACRPANTTDIATKVSNAAWFFKHKFLPGFCYREYGYAEYAPGSNRSAPVTACLDTYNTSSLLYTDRTVHNSNNNQWYWMLCNEPFAYYQTGSTPPGVPTIVSRLMTPEYFQRQCDILFGPKSPSLSGHIYNVTRVGAATYGSAEGKTVDNVNRLTGGWNYNAKRILWVNGEFDPWRSASVSSNYRPGGPLQSTPDSPLIVIKGGRHCEDFNKFNETGKPYLASVQLQETAYIAGWVDEFYDEAVQPGRNRTVPRFLPKAVARLQGVQFS